MDSEGYVYVSDSYNHRIQKFTSDGNFITKWGKEGDGEGEFDIPRGIAVGPEGNVYVADGMPEPKGEEAEVYVAESNHRIQKFTPDGAFITEWGSWGTSPGQMSNPRNVAVGVVNGTVYVYVTEFYNNRIQVFLKKPICCQMRGQSLSLAVNHPEDVLWDETQMYANFAYRTLTYQGFTKENHPLPYRGCRP